MELIPHTSYSPDFAPSDSFLFPTCERDLKDRHFESPKAALEVAETAFKHSARNGLQVFDKWQRRWVKCVALNGEYLEDVVVNTE